jgi:hypothetical protein
LITYSNVKRIPSADHKKLMYYPTADILHFTRHFANAMLGGITVDALD